MLHTNLLPLLLVTAVAYVQGCGYDSCPQFEPNKLNIHVIPHSHDDVGWVKTVDGYYDDEVRHIIDNVLAELVKNPKRRFVQVEQYYFYRWWKLQSNETRQKVKTFVKSGQLSFANGGWCVNDEASTHYTSIIDQMTLGLEFIRNTFGDCAIPKSSWQIDPFGASREMANLYALMEFDGHIVNRGSNLQGEFIWDASDTGDKIFTTHLHAHYSAPNGFNFEKDNTITDQNKETKAKELVELAKKWNNDYGKKGHVLIPFGDDFQYKQAERWYTNLDKLIETITEKHTDVHIFYSSPHCYIKAVKASQVEFKSQDYFPLWTGHYSSRPVVKALERYADGLLQSAKQLDVLAQLSDTQELLFEAKNELGILQHHDAITGTSIVPVMFDYRQRMTNTITTLQRVISRALGKLTVKNYDPVNRSKVEPNVYISANISDSTFELSSANFAVIIYNPLLHPQGKYIRIPVSTTHGFAVHDFDGREVKSVSLVPIAESVRQLIGHHKAVTHELVFEAQLPALGFTTYTVTSATNRPESKELKADGNENLVLKGKTSTFFVDSKSGQLKEIEHGGKKHRVAQNFAYYPSKHSSPYNFCPSGDPVPISEQSSLVSATQYAGFFEVQQKVNDYIHQTIRVYEDRDYAELDYVVGPIPLLPDIGKEVITRFETDLSTDKTWYTDSNGRQNMKRVHDDQVRSCENEKNTYSFNYYPITSRALIRDESAGLELSLHTDRAMGAASMRNGEIEVMLHRRLLPGVPLLPLNDTDIDGKGMVTRGHALLLLSSLKGESADEYRPVGPHMLMSPLVAFKSFSDVAQYKSHHIGNRSFLATKVPANVHLLSLENFGSPHNNEVLVRLENFYQSSDVSAKKLNTASSVSIDKLFAKEAVETESISETNLIVGNRKLAPSGSVKLEPQAIKTFLLKVKRNMPAKKACLIKWTKLENGKAPVKALEAGVDVDRSSLYVCRHQGGDNLPGKFSIGAGCQVAIDGKVHHFNDTNVEILTTESDVQWIPRHGGDALPPSAYITDTKKTTAAGITIGRCGTHNSIQVGQVDEYFVYSLGDRVNKDCASHEILTC